MLFAPHTVVRRCLLALASAFLLQAGGPARAAPPLASFFNDPEFSGALLSPDARHLAVRMSAGAERQRLAVVDLATFKVTLAASFKDADIGNFEWVNPRRLVFDTFDGQVGGADVRYGPGLYAVDRDGAKLKQLANRSGSAFIQDGSAAKMLPWNTRLVRQKGLQNSDEVYVTSRQNESPNEPGHLSLLRLNTVNGYTRSVERPGKTVGWLLDHQGEPRIAMTLERNIETIHYRDPASGAWRALTAFDAYIGTSGGTGGGTDSDGASKGFRPLAFGPDGTLYVSSRQGRDKAAVYPYDFGANAVGKQALVALDDFDAGAGLITSDRQLLGVRYRKDDQQTDWFNADMQALQTSVDALLPATRNLISVAARPATPYVLVTSFSDRQPLAYALFNSASGALTRIGASAPAIDPAEMGSRKLLRYAARDGLPIPAWLTLPPGGSGKNLPLVMLVHGGPYVRGSSWRWDAQAQFLASRGYAVLEPEYRGSTGFGTKHYRAGWKQWGLAMQDDIADGAKWAIAEGIADPKRICIAGASYGGYAALMGLVNDPDLYRCGVNWVGATDIGLLYTGHWSFASDMTDDWKQYGMPELIGDQVKDAAQFRATSPLQQAARIRQPLLLAYGGADKRVPLYHGTQFRDAVKKTNADVEWVVYEEEGHGWALPKNRIDFWGRVEKFLARNIGQPQP